MHDGEGLAARGGCRVSDDIKWVRVHGTTCALLLLGHLKLTPPPQPCSVEVRGTRSLALPERRIDATRSLPRRASSPEIARRPPEDPLERSVELGPWAVGAAEPWPSYGRRVCNPRRHQLSLSAAAIVSSLLSLRPAVKRRILPRAS